MLRLHSHVNCSINQNVHSLIEQSVSPFQFCWQHNSCMQGYQFLEAVKTEIIESQLKLLYVKDIN